MKLIRQSNNLNKRINEFKFIDTSADSKNYFRLRNIPNEFCIGVNYFNILPSNLFVPNTPLLIDILDSQGNALYYEISRTVNNDNSRLISVHIYKETPPGNITIYLAGTLKKSPITNEVLDSNLLNLLFVKNLTFNRFEVVDDLVFNEDPIVLYQEISHNVPYYNTQVNDRYTEIINSSGKIYGSNPPLTKFGKYDKQNKNTQNVLQSVPEIDPLSGKFITTPKVEQLPNIDQYTVVSSTDFTFESKYLNGKIYIDNNTTNYLPNSFKNVTIPGYTGSIVEVISNDTIKIFPPYNFEFTNEERKFNLDKFLGLTDFKIQYYDKLPAIDSGIVQNFLEFEFQNIKPSGGYLHNVEVKYKSISSLGDTGTLGFFEIKPAKLLVDKTDVAHENDGIHQKPIGKFDDFITFLLYWDYTGSPLVDPKLKNSIISNKGDSFQTSYDYELSANCLYNISLNYIHYGKDAQLDFYLISDTNDFKLHSNTKSIKKSPLTNSGFYIGSITEKDLNKKNKTFTFESNIRQKVKLKAILREGNWSVADIQLNSFNDNGFSPGHSFVYVPLDQLPDGNEFSFEISYFTRSGKRYRKNTKIYSVILAEERIIPI
jgi:hypothetical protein